MIGATGKAEPQFERIQQAAAKASFENIRHAALSLSKDVKSTIVRSKNPSQPGEVPTTRGQGGHNLRGAIFAAVEKDSAIIGPRHSFVADAGEAHEFGKERLGDDFDERAFMEPGLERAIPRFATDWAGSIGE